MWALCCYGVSLICVSWCSCDLQLLSKRHTNYLARDALDLKVLESKFKFKLKHGCGFCCITRGALTIWHVDLTEEYVDNKAHVKKRSSLEKRMLNIRLSCTFKTIIYRKKCIECPSSICLNIQNGVSISLNYPLQDFFHQLIESWIPYTKLEFLLESKLSWMFLGKSAIFFGVQNVTKLSRPHQYSCDAKISVICSYNKQRQLTNFPINTHSIKSKTLPSRFKLSFF